MRTPEQKEASLKARQRELLFIHGRMAFLNGQPFNEKQLIDFNQGYERERRQDLLSVVEAARV